MSTAIQCVKLTKRYPGGTLALDGLDLEIADGTTFGLVGANGAGKTTFVKLAMGFIFPSDGSIGVLGHAYVAGAHPRIGYVHERQFTDLYLTGRQYLFYMAGLSGVRGGNRRARIDEALRLTGMESAAGRRLRTYSKGMLQRIAIAQALLARPRLVILDEPTSGLDPPNQLEVRNMILGMRGEGTTVLLCSHNLHEVEELCDTVGILDRGRLLRCGPIATLRLPASSVEIALDTPEPAAQLISRLGLVGVDARDGALRVGIDQQATVLRTLLAANIPIRSLGRVEESLEDVYMRETRGLRISS